MTIPKLIFFDLDGTLTESKQPLTGEMSALLAKLLEHTNIAVISGGALPQFMKQVVEQLPSSANFANLFLLPVSGAALYEWQGVEWNKIYEERLSENEMQKIEKAMREASAETGLIDFSTPSYGERIERRGGEVSLSALGQQAPIALKKEWDPNKTRRHVLQSTLASRLPEFSVGVGGATTIDVTKKDIDKAYGARALCQRLGISESDALYVGDELEKGGNDEAVYKTKAQTRAVSAPAETARFIESLLSS